MKFAHFSHIWAKPGMTPHQRYEELWRELQLITLIALVSDAPGTKELKELSLAVNTPDGIVLVVGCSHPGIERIVEAAASINPKIQLIAGGFHLVVRPTTPLRRSWRHSRTPSKWRTSHPATAQASPLSRH